MTVENIANVSKTVADDSPVFAGTSVPTKELRDHMNENWNLYGFLRKFPSVDREQALDEIEKASRETVKRIIRCDRDGSSTFRRSSAPVKRLFDYLADGQSLKDFHWDFPSVLVEDTHDAVITSGRILESCAYRGRFTDLVNSNRATVSGAPVFTGTRLPIRILFDCLADAQTLKDFHYQHPTAAPDRIVTVVGLAGRVLESEAYAAAR